MLLPFFECSYGMHGRRWLCGHIVLCWMTRVCFLRYTNSVLLVTRRSMRLILLHACSRSNESYPMGSLSPAEHAPSANGCMKVKSRCENK